MACQFVAYFDHGYNEYQIARVFDTKPEFVVWAVKEILKPTIH